MHFRDPGFTYKEDIETGSRSALKGGYTICYAMANTKPVCDNLNTYNEIIKKSNNLNLIDLYQNISLTKNMEGKEVIDINDFPDKVKFLSDDGKGVLSNKLMLEAMNYAKEKNIGIMVHAEDPEISHFDYRVAEDIITIRDIYLANYTGCKVHFCHVSTKDSIEALIDAKKKGQKVTFEITPHHLYFHDLNFKVNPPIRSKSDVKACINSIRNGFCDAISTDHAPHSKEDKLKGAPGMIGLETAYGSLYKKLVVEENISLNRLSEVMSYGPGHILGLDHGLIEIGKKANFVIVDNENRYIVKDNFASKVQILHL